MRDLGHLWAQFQFLQVIRAMFGDVPEISIELYPRKDRGALCKLCRVHEDIEAYEGLIFHFVKSEIKAMKVSDCSMLRGLL